MDITDGLSLDVAIAGAGIAGLTAAIALRKAGHRVTIYESSNFSTEIGAAIHLPPNSSKILGMYGFNFEEARVVENKFSLTANGATLEPIFRTSHEHMREVYGSPWYLSHRVDLHNLLKRMALLEGGSGIPAVIKTRARVVSMDCDETSLTFQDGTTVRHDIIIGADGIHSRTIQSITGKETEAHATGFSAYRFLARVADLKGDPNTKWILDNDAINTNNFALGERKVTAYPCRNYEIMNFVAIHPDRPSSTKGDGWDQGADIADLLDEFKDFHHSIIALLRHAEDLHELKLWQLLYRPSILPWTRGSTCAIGDAVHPMLPHQAQGGAQSIEDGAAVGVLLSHITCKSEIPKRLQAFEELRYRRASVIQMLSNVGSERAKTLQQALDHLLDGESLATQTDHHKYTFTYDVVTEARKKLQQTTRTS